MMIPGMNQTSTSNRLWNNYCGMRAFRWFAHMAQRENIRQDAKKAVQRSVRGESSNVKGFGRRALDSPTFHLSRLTFHGS
jgi:hypothetical protein